MAAVPSAIAAAGALIVLRCAKQSPEPTEALLGGDAPAFDGSLEALSARLDSGAPTGAPELERYSTAVVAAALRRWMERLPEHRALGGTTCLKYLQEWRGGAEPRALAFAVASLPDSHREALKFACATAAELACGVEFEGIVGCHAYAFFAGALLPPPGAAGSLEQRASLRVVEALAVSEAAFASAPKFPAGEDPEMYFGTHAVFLNAFFDWAVPRPDDGSSKPACQRLQLPNKITSIGTDWAERNLQWACDLLGKRQCQLMCQLDCGMLAVKVPASSIASLMHVTTADGARMPLAPSQVKTLATADELVITCGELVCRLIVEVRQMSAHDGDGEGSYSRIVPGTPSRHSSRQSLGGSAGLPPMPGSGRRGLRTPFRTPGSARHRSQMMMMDESNQPGSQTPSRRDSTGSEASEYATPLEESSSTPYCRTPRSERRRRDQGTPRVAGTPRSTDSAMKTRMQALEMISQMKRSDQTASRLQDAMSSLSAAKSGRENQSAVQICELETTVSELESKLEQAVGQKREAEGKLAAASAKSAELQAAIAEQAASNMLEAACTQAMEQENAELKQLIDSTAGAADLTSGVANGLRAELEGARGELDAAQRSVAALQGESSSAQAASETYRQQLEAATAELGAAEQRHKEDIGVLNAELLQSQQESKELAEDVQQLNLKIEDFENTIETLQEAEAAALERLEEYKFEAAEELKSLEGQIQSMLASESEVASKLQQQKSNTKVATQKYTELKEQAAGLAEQVTQSKDAMTEMACALAAVQQELATVKNASAADSAAHEKRAAELEDELEEAQAAASELMDELDHAHLQTRGAEVAKEEADALTKQLARDRKKLHNQILELKGNIRVFCRVRPYESYDGAVPSKDDIAFPGDDSIALQLADKYRRGAQKFAFDKVYGLRSTQAQIFEEVEPIVLSALDGFSVCIFAYGQTGSGKTFTMEGGQSEEDRGVTYRSLNTLFETIEQRAGSDGVSTVVSVSMLEVYNESIRDLLTLTPSGNVKDDVNIVHDAKGGITVEGATEIAVSDIPAAFAVMDQGSANRKTACTNMNEHSSRSHLLFKLTIKVTNADGKMATGKLVLIDLAGSERVKRSKAEGHTMVEAQAINKSLSALGDVIAALQDKRGHVPFRNSKLTHLLQDCLGPNSKALMFANVSPLGMNGGESISTLNFATRVGSVELGKAQKSEASAGDAVVSLEKVAELKEQLEATKSAQLALRLEVTAKGKALAKAEQQNAELSKSMSMRGDGGPKKMVQHAQFLSKEFERSERECKQLSDLLRERDRRISKFEKEQKVMELAAAKQKDYREDAVRSERALNEERLRVNKLERDITTLKRAQAAQAPKMAQTPRTGPRRTSSGSMTEPRRTSSASSRSSRSSSSRASLSKAINRVDELNQSEQPAPLPPTVAREKIARVDDRFSFPPQELESPTMRASLDSSASTNNSRSNVLQPTSGSELNTRDSWGGSESIGETPNRRSSARTPGSARLSAHGSSAKKRSSMTPKRPATAPAARKKLGGGAARTATFEIGERFDIVNEKAVDELPRRGELMYLGKLPEVGDGIWAGLKLDEPAGKNDGSVKGTRYFACDDKYGSFVPVRRLQRLAGFV